MSHVMRKPMICICENKDADQLYCNPEADQRLCFPYIASTILLPKSEISSFLVAIFCSCTAWFVWDQNVGFLMTWLNYVNLSGMGWASPWTTLSVILCWFPSRYHRALQMTPTCFFIYHLEPWNLESNIFRPQAYHIFCCKAYLHYW